MRILIAAVGRAKPGPHLDLQRLYGDRLSWSLTVSEVEERRKLPPAERRERESEILLARVPDRAIVVALDERGTVLSSTAFAQKIAKWRESGVGDLAFLIGGADGHADGLRKRADFLLSLGLDDLAASPGARHVAGAALPGAADPRGPSVSPGMTLLAFG